MQHGQTGTFDVSTATGYVKKLLDNLQEPRRHQLLAKHVEKAGAKRRLALDPDIALRARKPDRLRIINMVDEWRATQARPAFYEVLDIARRVAGTGSLGLEHYVLLVAGDGSADQIELLSLKAATPSALAPYLKVRQPLWTSEAARVVFCQGPVAGMAPRYLAALGDEKRSYVLHELLPSDDRVHLDRLPRKRSSLESFAASAGRIVAWDQPRGAGQHGAAPADQLVQFAAHREWQASLLDYARAYSKQVADDFLTFQKAHPRKTSKTHH